ncbi:ABC transporter transmembrane region 2-domain-containing protein [Mycena amicta]|nr:ABC transporter transmembrane region 2-domain-containing protein [Mycena amicta]
MAAIPLSRKHAMVVVASLLLLRGRILALKLPQLRAPKLTPQQLADALQQVYVEDDSGVKTVLVPYRDRLSKLPIHPIPLAKFQSDTQHFPPIPSESSAKPNIDRVFLAQLKAILFRIAFPAFRSKETLIVVSHSFFLVLRTILSIMVARLDGVIVRDLVRADGKGFLKGLVLWFLLAIPSTYTNSMIRHLQSKLSLRLRTRVTRYTHDLYLSSAPELRYYRTGLEGVDQYLTADIESWAEALAGLYGNILKPSLDLILFTGQLSKSLGVRGSILLYATYYTTATILRAVTPAFGRLAAIEARLEGEYRAGMGRIGREGEEIAFYDGGARERDILSHAYLKLIKHINSIYKMRIAYEWTEDYVIKYLWSSAGYGVIAVPLLFTRRRRSVAVQAGAADATSGEQPDDAVAGRTETYISNRRLLISLADAGGRLMYAYKDLLELAGLTTRIYTLISTLHNLPRMPSAEADVDTIKLSNVNVGVPPSSAAEIELDDTLGAELLPPGSDSTPLVRDLSFVVKDGEHLMITGSNGVGKTAVARVLAGLWAPQGVSATVERPRDLPGRPSVVVVPQRAYMVTGSLLDQIIYPHAYPEFLKSGKTFEDLMEILDMVFLAYLPEREGGWTTRKEWRDVLSGGEKQRMGMARVLYHRPKYAVLDECTSAVSSDSEGQMYENLKKMGITLITISLRPSLAKYHTLLLSLTGDGTGKWSLSRVGTPQERVGIDREIGMLESRLEEKDKWEARVKELSQLLSVQEP